MMIETVFLILNYKTYQDTIKLVHELLSENLENRRIVVVDNASPNDSYEQLRDEIGKLDRVEVLSSGENGGYAKGNNYGLRYIEKYNPKFVCIINNDVHFSIETIEHLESVYDTLESPALISPIQMLLNGKKADFYDLKVPDLMYDLRLYSLFFANRQHVYKSNTNRDHIQKVGIIPGAFIFTNYSLFKNLGFFNELTFLFCEERFVAKEVELAGLNNYLILDCSYLHEHSKTISTEASFKKQAKMMLEGRLLYAKTYYKHFFVKGLLLRMAYYYSVITRYLIKLFNI